MYTQLELTFTLLGDKTMQRRHLLQAIASLSLGALALGTATSAFAQSTTLKISHQFPGGTLKDGDFRDRLVRQFALEVEKRTKGALKFEIYPGSSLMKTNAQFSSMRKGALDLALIPLSYAGGEVPEVNIGLMPGLVVSYEQAYGWKNKPVGLELDRVLQAKGILPHRALEDDLKLTDQTMSYDGSAARRATVEIRHNPIAAKNAKVTWPQRADGKPDFEKMNSAERLAYHQARLGD